MQQLIIVTHIPCTTSVPIAPLDSIDAEEVRCRMEPPSIGLFRVGGRFGVEPPISYVDICSFESNTSLPFTSFSDIFSSSILSLISFPYPDTELRLAGSAVGERVFAF